MDKLPKLRRKPKPPAIETSVNRARDDIPKSTIITEIKAQHPQSKPPMARSPLQNLKLRVTSKRARANSPASHTGSSPMVAVFGQDGVAPRSAMENNSSSANSPSRPPEIPAFLTSSLHDIELKFHELTWAERSRLAQGARPDVPANFRWGSFKQSDGPQRGFMDRYIDIKPWNYNRVKLQVPESEFDYVNASTITLNPLGDSSLPSLRYIAMQGPTVPSFDYVWRMIAEQTRSPAVIVQLTSMVEGGAIKCHQYFPDDDEDPTWVLNEDNIWNDGWKAKLTYDSWEEQADGAIEKRKLLLHVEGEAEPRTVWHFLYTRWPDFGVPTLDDMDSFLELMTVSRAHSNPANARIIHCSAGVGRTGTFICLEHLIRELEAGNLEADTLEIKDSDTQEEPDLIYSVVDNLRQQRRRMVQSEVQYRFVYEVMHKLWQDKYGIVLGGHDADSTGNSEPAAKRLEVANLSGSSDIDA